MSNENQCEASASADVIYMRTKLFARCKCRKIIEVIIFKGSGKSFRISGICPYCSKKINRIAFRYEKARNISC